MQVITLCELGGAQSVVINLSNSLCKEHEVIVVAGDGDGKMWQMLSDNIKQIKIKYLKRTLSPIYDFFAIILLMKAYVKYKPDIIHLHSSKVGILGRIVFPRKKIIYTVHGFDSIRLAYRKYLPIERFMQYRCKAIVGVSEYDKNNLLSENINNHIECIYNGIERPVSLQKGPFNLFKNYKYRILCIARLSPQKNSSLFLNLALLLPEYAFIWIGNQFEPMGTIPSNVFFMGNISNAGAYNEYVDLFILPSNYEGLPIVILEAMSFGKPIVASNVGGVSEIVINDENGYTVENIPEAFASKIQYILENKDIYKRFSENSLKRYEKDLTVEKMVKGYMKVYQS
jgi:glycosyltransferase involved in cell wall biosynthesis